MGSKESSLAEEAAAAGGGGKAGNISHLVSFPLSPKTHANPNFVRELCISPSGEKVAAFCDGSGEVFVYDLKKREQMKGSPFTVHTVSTLYQINFSPNSNLLLLSTATSDLYVYSGKPPFQSVAKISGHTNLSYDSCWFNNNFVFSTSYDQKIRISSLKADAIQQRVSLFPGIETSGSDNNSSSRSSSMDFPVADIVTEHSPGVGYLYSSAFSTDSETRYFCLGCTSNSHGKVVIYKRADHFSVGDCDVSPEMEQPFFESYFEKTNTKTVELPKVQMYAHRQHINSKNQLVTCGGTGTFFAVIDIESATLLCQQTTKEPERMLRVVWLGDSRILTCGERRTTAATDKTPYIKIWTRRPAGGESAAEEEQKEEGKEKEDNLYKIASEGRCKPDSASMLQAMHSHANEFVIGTMDPPVLQYMCFLKWEKSGAIVFRIREHGKTRLSKEIRAHWNFTVLICQYLA